MSLMKVNKITGKTGTATGAISFSGDNAEFVSGIATPNPKELDTITLPAATTTTFFGVVKTANNAVITVPSDSILQVI